MTYGGPRFLSACKSNAICELFAVATACEDEGFRWCKIGCRNPRIARVDVGHSPVPRGPRDEVQGRSNGEVPSRVSSVLGINEWGGGVGGDGEVQVDDHEGIFTSKSA